ncbi:MAG TPA: hypothetical protein DCS93_23330 [Microscillaceae bacterium]|nr:hypothetical protein [Microscillaceae bacterium]
MNVLKTMYPLLIVLLILQASCKTTPKTNPKIAAYLNEALDTIRTYALNTEQVNWEQLRKEVIEKAQGAKTTPEVYHLVRYALQSLKDDHSFLQLSDSLITLEKNARKDQNSTQAHTSKKAPSPYGRRMKIEHGIHEVGNLKIARIFVPQGMRDNKFAQRLHDLVVEMGKQQPCGWIVDLRGNGGGNMWPMLAGVGHLVGENPLAGSVDGEGRRDYYLYKSGKAIYKHKTGKEDAAYAEVKEAAFAGDKNASLAFLIDRGTASSGESLATILKGRKNTRGFGETTYGASTSTRGFKLSDGSNLVIAVSTFQDRQGNKYPDGIKPDVEITIGNQKEDPAQDPVIKAAIAWLQTQASCKK